MPTSGKSLKVSLWISIILNILLIALASFLYYTHFYIHTPLAEVSDWQKSKTLQKYSYDALRKTQFESMDILFGPVTDETDAYVARTFTYTVEGKKVSGLAHFPKKEGHHPVLILIRGYVDLDIYEPGVGSSPAARYFATNGYITLAPDFLGYGTSDKPPIEPLADRLIAYPTVLQLLADVHNLNTSMRHSSISLTADQEKVGIWAHSNGGQIGLSVLEASGKSYPTVLWAPVSKPFPYSVLYFTDEFDDNGKYLRHVIADFENDYNIELFTLSNYFDWIDSPIQLHQGALDDAVPIKWSDQLVEKLKGLGKDVEYFTYPDADHNMRPDWDTAAKRSLEFFNLHLMKS